MLISVNFQLINTYSKFILHTGAARKFRNAKLFSAFNKLQENVALRR